ncbi:hypothetical protein GQR58_008217 [Nymphon striatum]|nr:hypothetical protein GQR58_008217 [Nymphon striatum]
MPFVGHVLRKHNFEKNLLTGSVYGKRGRGKPKTRYSDNIKENMNGRTLSKTTTLNRLNFFVILSSTTDFSFLDCIACEMKVRIVDKYAKPNIIQPISIILYSQIYSTLLVAAKNKYGAIANFTSEPPFSKMAAKMA